MKILVLKTYTVDCDNKYRSLICIGHDVIVQDYDDRSVDRQMEIVSIAQNSHPDAIVYIGAVEGSHGRPVLKPDILKRLTEIAPTIHLCGDAADPPWWPWLELYDRENCFTVQVSMDGSSDTPLRGFNNGLILLTPTDASVFNPVLWGERVLGGTISGGGGFGRGDTLNALSRMPGFEWRTTNRGMSYDEFGAFLSRCRVVANHSASGTGRHHVKGRVVEAGFAGACLLESRNSVTSSWFAPDIDYLQYDDPGDAMNKVRWIQENDAQAENMAASFHKRIIQEHHPRVFWDKVFKRAGELDARISSSDVRGLREQSAVA